MCTPMGCILLCTPTRSGALSTFVYTPGSFKFSYIEYLLYRDFAGARTPEKETARSADTTGLRFPFVLSVVCVENWDKGFLILL
jgi:hypothetical protein